MKPIVPLAVGAAGLLFMLTRGSTAGAATYSTAPPDGSAPPQKEPAPRAKGHAEMSEGMKKQVAAALSAMHYSPNGTFLAKPKASAIAQGTQTAALLQSQGFFDAARDLRKITDEASKMVATPAAMRPVIQTAPAQLSPSQKDYLARVMAMERNPAVLSSVVKWLQSLPPSTARTDAIGTVQALIVQVAAAQSTAETVDKIEQVIKSPGVPQVQRVAQTPLPPVMVQPTPAAVARTSPPVPMPVAIPAALPEHPAVVPKTPIPQPVPRQLSAVERLARDMASNLAATQSRFGLKGAKTRFDVSLVKRFQSATGATKPDGKPGPNTFILAAGKGATALPFVMFWPRRATAKTVLAYRGALSQIADKYQALGRAPEANQLRMTAARERGQGGIGGRMPV